MDTITIRPLAELPAADVEALLDQVFGADRHARTAYRVRTGLSPLDGLSFAARDDAGSLLGSIQCWPVALTTPEGVRQSMIMVGPVAVSPDHRDQGIGRALMAAVFGALRPEAAMPLMLIGDPEYYGRLFGYSADRTGGWMLPGPFEPHRLLALFPHGATAPEAGMIGPFHG